jgi:hypothetical protein
MSEKQVKLSAVTMTEERARFKNILVSHDVSAFREFVASTSVVEIPEDKRSEILEFSDSDMSEYMHTIKSQQVYLGEAYQNSRNFFRERALFDALGKAGTPINFALRDFVRVSGKYPLCKDCRYFSEGPLEGDAPCSALGGTPFDLSCAGWTPVVRTEIDAPLHA